MGCRRRRFLVRRQAVAGGLGDIVVMAIAALPMFMPIMIRVVADAGRRICAWSYSTMIAATENAVREHVQTGQDGDQGSHVE